MRSRASSARVARLLERAGTSGRPWPEARRRWRSCAMERGTPRGHGSAVGPREKDRGRNGWELVER